MPYPYDAPRPRSRLGAAVHSFFHPNEVYRLGQRTLSAEREVDYYARSARNSEERALSAEYDRNSAEYAADHHARLADVSITAVCKHNSVRTSTGDGAFREDTKLDTVMEVRMCTMLRGDSGASGMRTVWWMGMGRGLRRNRRV